MPIELVELSHVIEDGLDTYPGIPGPRVRDFLARDESESHYAKGTRFAITSIEMVANTGTYLDAPFHRFEDGKDLAELALASLANLPGLRVETRATRIGPEAFGKLDVEGRAVLVATGWSKHWETPSYMSGYPCLTKEAAELLVEREAALVGIDSPNVDDNTDGARPVHTWLLGAEIPIVEHLTALDALPEEGFRFFAVPPRIRRFTSFPVRAFALVETTR